MYVIRRGWAVKSRQARRAATIAAEIIERYQQIGQRTDARVYFNGGSLPGKKDRLFMEWATERIESPYRGDNEAADTGDLGAQLRELTDDTWIEFHELFTQDKAQPE